MNNSLDRNPWTQALVAELTGRNGGLLPGEELWHSGSILNIYQFRAVILETTRRGEIMPITPIIEKRSEAYCVVIRLKHPRKMWPLWMAAIVSVLGFSLVAGLWLWQYRWPILMITGTTVLTLMALNRVSHSGACSGLHCSGCRK